MPVRGRWSRCGCGLSRRGSETCRSDSLGYMACVCPDTDAGSMPDVASVDTPPADREIPPPDRTPSGEDVAEAGGETGTDVDDVVLVLDAGTPDDGPQGIDTGTVDASADRESPSDTGTDVVDAGGLLDVTGDAAGTACSPEGARACPSACRRPITAPRRATARRPTRCSATPPRTSGGAGSAGSAWRSIAAGTAACGMWGARARVGLTT